ncbi:MAG: imidazole glycerol phosphate synthase subunit HisH [Methanosarcinales archaeon]|jgi:glutamine amidotransferase|nr:imidazole glycerol phosphate synthase subunit HisH [Methanosarcinales archaeon]MCK4652433.1 imidazole glycerol phosphate synthase subunit HisH [Methanosarcinales archaeon]MCK4810763.1 imidazole glycerol phosphate synthase subunit HisH [Methanosarcinales archaeon]
MIAIIDYGMGNLRSIHNALAKVGGNPVIVSDSNALLDADADAVVIPGVGSFGDAMRNLTPFSDRLFDLVDSGTPLLGICIGMQVLFERSEESDAAGFGLLEGDVIRLPDGVKIPQMGWNELTIRSDTDLLAGINDGDFFYFVHSYYCVPEDERVIAATTDYGVDMAAVVEKDNIHAVQFHPEKSSKKGLKILKNFVEMVKC